MHCILSLWRFLQQLYGSFEGTLCRMELSYIYPVIFFMLLASLYRQSSASVRFDADNLVPACSCRPRIVRINDSLYVRCCFFSPLRLDVDFPHGFRRLRFLPFLSPYFQSVPGIDFTFTSVHAFSRTNSSCVNRSGQLERSRS